MRLLIALSCVLLFGCASAGSPDADGFVPLFNGKDLTGWVRVNCAPETFRAEDGRIITTGKPTGVMRTDRMYENFVIELDWMHLKERGNSGLFLHSGAVSVKGQPFTKGHEIQVLDGDSPDGTWTGHGDVFSIHGATFEPDRPHPKGWMRCLPSEKRANPAGQWNHYRVTSLNGSIKLEVNGKEVSGGTKCNPRKGYICLESEGSECHFKNIRIKELPSTNPTPAETAEAYQGFQALYSGLDFRGWRIEAGDEGHWKTKDWVLEYDGKGSAGKISTEKSFGNAEVIVDWRTGVKDFQPSFCLRDRLVTVSAPTKPNDWMRTTLRITGNRFVVLRNGQSESEHEVPSTPRGPFCILLSTGPVQIANVFVKELD